MTTNADRQAREDDLDERRVEARRERLWDAAQERQGTPTIASPVLRASGLPDAPPAPAADLIAGRAEFVIDATGQPLTRVAEPAPRDPRAIAAEALATARRDRGWHELAQHPEPATVTFFNAAHHCATVAASLLLTDMASPAYSLTGAARAYATAYQLLTDRAALARAAWATRSAGVAA